MTATAIAGSNEPEVLLSDHNLSAQELDQARLFLQQTLNAVVGPTKGLSEAQWNFKPSADRWSIAGNLDHIVIVLERVLNILFHQLPQAPAPPAGIDCRVVDAVVINQFPTRLDRFPAPEIIHPAHQIAPLDLLHRLRESYVRLANCLESQPGLRRHACESAPLKAVSKGAFQFMDGYQFILAAAAHTERHAKQILEVMADPGYPAH
ncbi:MAG TPA: DinB family protein [Bryobacteraceae bacterium]|jgi:hypothetical protein